MILVNTIFALHIVVTGRVQGVGFRPFVSRIANEYGLAGWVRNRSGQVEIHVEGNQAALTAFQDALINRAPPLAQSEQPKVNAVECTGLIGFVIEHSEAGETADNHIPPDYFVCADCLAEMQEPAERRYRYPFINCTQCGPRYTLIDALPYDRPFTAMADFPLCAACNSEYSNPLDRRYHAQPLACATCGPYLTFRRPDYPDITDNEAALTACITGLKQGLIIAVKGVGGYHLLCDASNPAPIAQLRQRKLRPDKPLAVMVPWRGDDGMEQASQLANLQDNEKKLLCSPLRPIVLVSKKSGSILANNIAPDLAEVGLMLPYSPLHHLLADGYDAPLVATSANISGEPVLTENQELEARLSKIADAFLHHNRPIRRPADDSVFRRIAGKVRPIRLGRGITPLERTLPFHLQKPILAIGADLKNTIALGFNNRVVISPHIGDLGSLRSAEVFERVIADLQRLYAVKAEMIVCDAHPGYHSKHWARNQQLPILPVFHHHAHASALAGEHGVDESMLVFTWDGTGYGEDGSIWGGETLLGSPGAWQRVGSLKPFHLLTGDKAVREPWRVALSLCLEQNVDWPDCPRDTQVLSQIWQRRLNCPRSSSAGRLFDAAAALISIAHHSSYEGHAAMQLEALSDANSDPVRLPLAEDPSALLISDWGPLLPLLMDQEISQSERASIFHASLAGLIVDQATFLANKHGIHRIGLTGGVFQNRLLTEYALTLLNKLGFEVYLHADIPSGDGGISFGQLMEAGFRNEAVSYV